jgi:LruC domain-containing protein
MKTNRNLLAVIGASVLIFSSCADAFDDEQNPKDLTNVAIQDLKIPKGFDFSTEQTVKVIITDPKTAVKYDVYAYSDKKTFKRLETYENESGITVTDSIFSSQVDHLIFSGVAYNGILSHNITIPAYYSHIYLLRNDNLKFTSSTIKIVNKEAAFNAASITSKTANSKSTVVTDYLYAVNNAGHLFQTNPLTGVTTLISNMPMGSISCAIDQANKVLYSIGSSAPQPLMKYSIETNTWTTVGNIGINPARLEFNAIDGLLYVSNGEKLYTYNPITGARIKTWTITGLHDNTGGDLAFADDGTLFICTFSGLYRLNPSGTTTYASTRISADNLPFQPTSMTIDSNQELWLGHNSGGEGNLTVMDTKTGGYLHKYGPNANSTNRLNRGINDLTTFRVFTQTVSDPDSDGDGIPDKNDAFPQDNGKAFESFTPSKYGWGTIAFEDLWPYTGDYDFNDLVVNYKATAVLNSQNLAVQIDFDIKVKAVGGSFTNGFGIEIPTVTPSQIKSVTGTVLSENIVQLSANGTENGQQKAVVILFDNSQKMSNKEFKVSIKFNSPISTAVLGNAPFNPFMIKNKVRATEVHLPNKSRTTLGQNVANVPGINRDINGDYLTDSGLPWAINIIHDFKTPKEKVPVNQAYLKFNLWASSGGTSLDDWYKDNTGYRVADKINN